MTSEDKQKILREWVNHPGTRIMAEELRRIAKATLKEQLKADPYCEPERIMKAKQLRYILKNTLPSIIEKIVNYKEPPTKARWSIMNLFRRG